MVAEVRVSFDTELSWEIGGESVLYCATIPAAPSADQNTVIRITHGNVYGPMDHVRLFVRIGNPEHPTDFSDLTSADDWVEAQLIEEIVCVDDVEMHRSDASEPFGQREEVPWDGTFEASLPLPTGKQSVEIKVLSESDYPGSGVISDWIFDVK